MSCARGMEGWAQLREQTMRHVLLHTDQGRSIPLLMATHDDNIVLECREPGDFLNHVANFSHPAELAPDVYLRSVTIPEEGAFFQLRDQFGTLVDEIVRLSNPQAKRLLLDRIW